MGFSYATMDVARFIYVLIPQIVCFNLRSKLAKLLFSDRH
uniref:Uncharacterized protein n=1 Tax=Anguilla anguilla TaxID=7936 RepID=A0A0E9TW80_ANGAN